MVSDLKTFVYKGCKIATQKKSLFLANFALLAGFLWYRCYYPHRSREALSPVCGIFSFILGQNKKFSQKRSPTQKFALLWNCAGRAWLIAPLGLPSYPHNGWPPPKTALSKCFPLLHESWPTHPPPHIGEHIYC